MCLRGRGVLVHERERGYVCMRENGVRVCEKKGGTCVCEGMPYIERS